MALFNHIPPASKSLRVLALLLGYPDAPLRAHWPDLRTALQDEQALPAERLAELSAFIDTLARKPVLEVEADYVEMFDRGRSTSLHLFEHVHGDSRDRGPAMIDLTKTYEQAGLFLGEGELPDFLPVVLEFASTLAPRQAREFLGEMAHIFNAIFAALQKRQSAYAVVLGALLELAGEKASPVEVAAEEPIDAIWQEPVVFDGCSSQGQARPGQPQPIHIVPKAARPAHPSSGAPQ
ncbi:nitrate reductase molybdenum cofactor assembly chaperone [Simplicispira psychrophila]|uniref:nitrate reductase molybdenum cofactor assembly chaperone n=1 Tax=Simplicispira psychrophila TaxID=80882 RepID=UPI000483BEE8|nr:nitrate reductase molybdenum cofactor assembly chaperone [Simplicispira psychrophila]